MEDGAAPCKALLAGPDPPPSRLGPCETTWIPLAKARPIPGASRVALRLVPLFEAVAFTSPRAPRLLALDAREHGVLDALARALAGRRVWAIGPRTAEEARAHFGVEPLTPPEYNSLALARSILQARPGSVLALRRPGSGWELAEALAAGGVPYAEAHVYTVELDPQWHRRVARERVDVVVATSRQIARAILGADALRGLPVVAIGPPTRRELLRGGVEPACTAKPSTLEGVALCLTRLFPPGV